MKRFLLQSLFVGLGVMVLVGIVLPVRIALRQGAVREAFTLAPDVETVCFGDSHMGCSIVEAPQFHNRVLWNPATPPLFSLIRLYELERLGSLQQIKTVIIEVGFQNGWESAPASLNNLLGMHFAWAWRYLRFFPREALSFSFDSRIGQEFTSEISYAKPTHDIPFYDYMPAGSVEASDEILTHPIDTISVRGGNGIPLLECIGPTLLEIKQFCVQRGLRLVVFSSPVTQRYFKPSPMWTHNEVTILQDWLRKEGFEYYDFRHTMEERYFADFDHLRVTGAKLFTERFFKDLGLYTPALNDPISPSANEEGR